MLHLYSGFQVFFSRYSRFLLLAFISIASSSFLFGGSTKKLHNTIFLSKTQPDSSQSFDFNDYYFQYNKYSNQLYYSTPTALLGSDTLTLSQSTLNVRNKFLINENEFVEIWWRVFVDSSMENKLIGLDINKAIYSSVFWDNNLIIEQGKMDLDSKKTKKNKSELSVYPLQTGSKGWHNLIIRQKYSGVVSNQNYLTFYNYSVERNYIKYLLANSEKKGSFRNIFLSEGFRFFLLCLFIVSLLFYLIVQKTNSFLWFSIFCFCILLLSFQEMVNFEGNFYSFITMFSIVYILLFSFLAFVFYTFSGKIPKRIFVYFVLFIIALSCLLTMAFQDRAEKYEAAMVLCGITFGVVILILFIEIIIQIIYAIRIKERRVKIIAFGILQVILLVPLSLYLHNSISPYLITISIYLLPISFLIALIFIVRDSFTQNITKQAEVLILTQANEKILAEQNENLEIQVQERTEEVLKQKEEVEDKNRQILDSIEYALRIQTAILPSQKIVKQYLENSFILYKPKDIIAGDFYWMETTSSSTEGEELVLFAACDCTGHGVPGAMVSVVCYNALNRAVKEFGLRQPAAILDKTAEIVVESFSKSEEEIKDGMDISLCSYNTKTRELQWAGANNPLWIIRKSKQSLGAEQWELVETKADKQPIGMNEDHHPFTNYSYLLNSEDTIYIFTDGYADQFGGNTGEVKLTRKKFKEQLLALQSLSMQAQGIALDEFILNFQGKIEQVDDILVMGIRV